MKFEKRRLAEADMGYAVTTLNILGEFDEYREYATNRPCLNAGRAQFTTDRLAKRTQERAAQVRHSRPKRPLTQSKRFLRDPTRNVRV